MFLLSILLISSISAFPLDLERLETCSELKDRFLEQFNTAVRGNHLHQGLASHLAVKCQKILKCEKNHEIAEQWQLSITTRSKIEFSDKICKILDLLSTPVGECMDFLRDEHDGGDLMLCYSVQEKRRLKSSKHGKSDPKKDFMDAFFEEEYNTTTSCDSLFNNCTRTAIATECDTSVLDAIDENKDLLKEMNCAGVEAFSMSMMKMLDTMKKIQLDEIKKAYGEEEDDDESSEEEEQVTKKKLQYRRGDDYDVVEEDEEEEEKEEEVISPKKSHHQHHRHSEVTDY